MPGHRFFTPFQDTDKKIIVKDPDEFQHLAAVLRLKVGDPLEIVNGRGWLACGIIEEISRSSAVISVREMSFVPRAPGPVLTLACAIPKKAKFETVIEKCTELGVDRIVPLITERTAFSLDGERAEKRAVRFFRVVVNAAKQCKRLWFPEIRAALPFETAIQELAVPEAVLFIPWLEGERMPLSQALAAKAGMKHAIFFIGPEGDFTPDEVKLAMDAGAVPVSLGKNVLKVDTAAIAVVACAVLMRKGQ